jgi:hypothetical protein
MKYFFLAEGWVVGRVWSTEGLWREAEWRRKPEITAMNLTIVENQETLILYRVEPLVLMLEVYPGPTTLSVSPTIGQVVLKRLITADQVLDRLAQTPYSAL